MTVKCCHREEGGGEIWDIEHIPDQHRLTGITLNPDISNTLDRDRPVISKPHLAHLRRTQVNKMGKMRGHMMRRPAVQQPCLRA
jgi:hypothetical protein